MSRRLPLLRSYQLVRAGWSWNPSKRRPSGTGRPARPVQPEEQEAQVEMGSARFRLRATCGLASGVLYASLLVAPLLLARRFRGDPEWEALRLPAVATTIGSAALLGLFWSDTMAQWGGVIQRVIATVPLGMMAALAVKLLSRDPQAVGPATGRTAR